MAVSDAEQAMIARLLNERDEARAEVQRLRDELAGALFSLRAVEHLLDPATEMAALPYGPSPHARYFREKDIRDALEGTWH
jgi:hypothetical protein